MKFIKGFVTTIALYVGLSMVFSILSVYMLAPESVGLLFSSLGSIAPVFYLYLANPVILGVFNNTSAFITNPSDLSLLVNIFGSIVPVIVAALVGSIVERKSGSVKYIFLSTFVGLMVVASIGIVFQIVGMVDVDAISKFLTSGLIMSALNAFIWCAFGLFITSKGWG
jgi:hypothetical protein